MNCLACELLRAKVKARLMLSVGKSPYEIAEHLSKHYGERYFASFGVIYRKSKIAPFIPYKIL